MTTRPEAPITFDADWARRFLAGRNFERDVRQDVGAGERAPREVRFHQGWADAARGHRYTDETLRELTWQNLGYRCRLALGEGGDAERALAAFRARFAQLPGREPPRPRPPRPTGKWSHAEAVAALATWLDVRDGSISQTPGSPVWRLARLTGRTLAAAYARMQDLKKVDPGHTGGLHATAQLMALWDRFSDPATGDLDRGAVRAEYARLWKDGSTASPSTGPTTHPGIELRPYVRADETIEPRPRSPATYDPDAVGRGSRSHARIQNALSDHLSAANIKPGRPERGDPQFDLGWKIDSTFYVAEVKSLTRDNEEKQLRLGLGQVLRYRHQLRGRMPTIVAVLAVEQPPTDRSWVELCDELGVRLVWPDDWEGLSRAAGELA